MARRNKEDNTSRTQIIIAVIGLLGVLTAALITNGDKWFRSNGTDGNGNANGNANSATQGSPTPPVKEQPKVVAVMDNNTSYRESERRPGGRTNHDDIEDALKATSLSFVQFHTNLEWVDNEDNFRKLREAKPDLIIVHTSAFADRSDPDDTSEDFRKFLLGAMAHLPATKLLIYSRAFRAVTESKIENYVSSISGLKERTTTFKVEPGPDRLYFKDGQVSRSLRDEVKRMLSLP